MREKPGVRVIQEGLTTGDIHGQCLVNIEAKVNREDVTSEDGAKHARGSLPTELRVGLPPVEEFERAEAVDVGDLSVPQDRPIAAAVDVGRANLRTMANS